MKKGGCDEKETVENPTPDEARSWIKKGICPTGKECEPDRTCISEYANYCKEFGQYTVSKGPEILKWKGRRWSMWTRDTCTQSWSCNIIKYTSRVITEFGEKGNSEVRATITDRRTIVLNDDFFNTGVEEADGSTDTIEKQIAQPYKKTTKAMCFSSSLENIRCIFKELEGVQNVPVELDKNMEGKSGNTLIRLSGKLTLIKDGRVTVVSKPDASKREIVTKDYYSEEGAASVKEVLQLAATIHAQQMMSNYNIQELERRTTVVQNSIIKMLPPLSQIDKMVIGDVLGIPNSKSVWLSDKVFKLCPCFKLESPSDTNCDNSFLYGPIHIERTRGNYSRCNHFGNSARGISPFDNETKIILEDISTMPVRGAQTNEETWIEMEERKRKEDKGPREEKEGSLSDEKLGPDVLSILNYEKVKEWVVLTGAILGWCCFLRLVLTK